VYVTAAPLKLVEDEKLPPVVLQVTPAESFVVAVTESVCVTVSAARSGDTLTVMPCDNARLKVTPLLACPPTVTTTFPVVAPVGTLTTIVVALQVVGAAGVPLNVTVLLPWLAAKFVPVIVTGVPIVPEFGFRLVIVGAGWTTVKLTALLVRPATVTTTPPVVAPEGTVVVILVAVQVVTVATVPLNLTVLVPCVAPKFVPMMLTAVPTAPELGLRFEMVGPATEIMNFTPLLA
jgi:hypothetical protein